MATSERCGELEGAGDLDGCIEPFAALTSGFVEGAVLRSCCLSALRVEAGGVDAVVVALDELDSLPAMFESDDGVEAGGAGVVPDSMPVVDGAGVAAGVAGSATFDAGAAVFEPAASRAATKSGSFDLSTCSNAVG